MRPGEARTPVLYLSGVGFIALFGVAVLNGVVLISYVWSRCVERAWRPALLPWRRPGSDFDRC